MKRKLLQFAIIFATLLSAILSPLTPLVAAQSADGTPNSNGTATTRCDRKFYSANDILYYNPCDTSTQCSTGQVTVSSSLQIAQTDNVKTIYAYLTTTPIGSNGNKPLTPAQAAGVMGNFYAESGFNPSAVEATSRADKGHGLAQWTFGRWTNLSNFAASQGKPWDDITLQLDFLKQELEGPEQAVLKDSEFASATDPSVAAMRWRIVFERADPSVSHDDKRQGAAISIYNSFGGTAASCESSGFAVAGNLVQTAINLALTTPAVNGMTSQSQARDTYQKAKPQYNPKVDWTDCGGFIATSMYASGVDKDYPSVGVSTQLSYVQNHPEKYLVTIHPSMNDLKPGDILYISGHTTMYTGASPYPMVDASLGDRVPSVRPTAALQWMLSQSEIVSARLIK